MKNAALRNLWRGGMFFWGRVNLNPLIKQNTSLLCFRLGGSSTVDRHRGTNHYTNNVKENSYVYERSETSALN